MQPPSPMIEWVSGKEFRNLNFNVENWGKIMQIILSFYKDVQLYGLLYNLKLGEISESYKYFRNWKAFYTKMRSGESRLVVGGPGNTFQIYRNIIQKNRNIFQKKKTNIFQKNKTKYGFREYLSEKRNIFHKNMLTKWFLDKNISQNEEYISEKCE